MNAYSVIILTQDFMLIGGIIFASDGCRAKQVMIDDYCTDDQPLYVEVAMLTDYTLVRLAQLAKEKGLIV